MPKSFSRVLANVSGASAFVRSQAFTIEKVGRSNSVAFCQACNNKLASFGRKFLVCQIASNTAQIRHARKIVVEFEVVGPRRHTDLRWFAMLAGLSTMQTFSTPPSFRGAL